MNKITFALTNSNYFGKTRYVIADYVDNYVPGLRIDNYF